MNALTTPPDLKRTTLLCCACLSIGVLLAECEYVANLPPEVDLGNTLGTRWLRSMQSSTMQVAHSVEATRLYLTESGYVNMPPDTNVRDPRLVHVDVQGSVEPIGLWAGELLREDLRLVCDSRHTVPADGSLHAGFAKVRAEAGVRDSYPPEFAKGDLDRTSIRWAGVLHDAITVLALYTLWKSVKTYVAMVLEPFRARRRPGICRSCQYSLDGLPTTSCCPECGVRRAA